MLFDDREMRKEMRVEVRYEFFMEVGRAALEACWWDICQTEFVCVVPSQLPSPQTPARHRHRQPAEVGPGRSGSIKPESTF